ncbi:MAG TPA: hypothetical protein VK386_07735 [Acidimicrobiales bacterium]|nr:hypothetical protein [Acidimicrobiales bacterium]
MVFGLGDERSHPALALTELSKTASPVVARCPPPGPMSRVRQ